MWSSRWLSCSMPLTTPLSGLAVFFLCLAFLLGLVRFLYCVCSRCDVSCLVCWSCMPHELFLVRLDSFLTGLRETQHVSKSMILCHPSALAGCWWGTIYIIVSLVPRTTRGGLQAHSVIVGCESNRFFLLPPGRGTALSQKSSSRRVARGQGFSCATRSRSGLDSGHMLLRLFKKPFGRISHIFYVTVDFQDIHTSIPLVRCTSFLGVGKVGTFAPLVLVLECLLPYVTPSAPCRCAWKVSRWWPCLRSTSSPRQRVISISNMKMTKNGAFVRHTGHFDNEWLRALGRHESRQHQSLGDCFVFTVGHGVIELLPAYKNGSTSFPKELDEKAKKLHVLARFSRGCLLIRTLKVEVHKHFWPHASRHAPFSYTSLARRW